MVFGFQSVYRSIDICRPTLSRSFHTASIPRKSAQRRRSCRSQPRAHTAVGDSALPVWLNCQPRLCQYALAFIRSCVDPRQGNSAAAAQSAAYARHARPRAPVDRAGPSDLRYRRVRLQQRWARHLRAVVQATFILVRKTASSRCPSERQRTPVENMRSHKNMRRSLFITEREHLHRRRGADAAEGRSR